MLREVHTQRLKVDLTINNLPFLTERVKTKGCFGSYDDSCVGLV